MLLGMITECSWTQLKWSEVWVQVKRSIWSQKKLLAVRRCCSSTRELRQRRAGSKKLSESCVNAAGCAVEFEPWQANKTLPWSAEGKVWTQVWVKGDDLKVGGLELQLLGNRRHETLATHDTDQTRGPQELLRSTTVHFPISHRRLGYQVQIRVCWVKGVKTQCFL